jgi:hypothetical protein
VKRVEASSSNPVNVLHHSRERTFLPQISFVFIPLHLPSNAFHPTFSILFVFLFSLSRSISFQFFKATSL